MVATTAQISTLIKFANGSSKLKREWSKLQEGMDGEAAKRISPAGVEFDDDGNVIKINVYSKGLRGHIPALKKMTRLEISGTKLKAPELVDMYAYIHQTPHQQLRTIYHGLINTDRRDMPFVYAAVDWTCCTKLFIGEFHLNKYRWFCLLTITVFGCFGFLAVLDTNQIEATADLADFTNGTQTDGILFAGLNDTCIKLPPGFDQAFFDLWSLFTLTVAICGGSVLTLLQPWYLFAWLMKLPMRHGIDFYKTWTRRYCSNAKVHAKVDEATEALVKEIRIQLSQMEEIGVADLSSKEPWFERFGLLDAEAEQVDVAASKLLFAVSVLLGWITVLEYFQQLNSVSGDTSCKLLLLATMPLYKPLQAPMLTIILSLINQTFKQHKAAPEGESVKFQLPPEISQKLHKHSTYLGNYSSDLPKDNLKESLLDNLGKRVSALNFFRSQRIRVTFAGEGQDRQIVLADETEPAPNMHNKIVATTSVMYLPLALLLGLPIVTCFFPIFLGVLPILLLPLFVVWVVVQAKAQWTLFRLRATPACTGFTTPPNRKGVLHEDAIKCTQDGICGKTDHLLKVMKNEITMRYIEEFMTEKFMNSESRDDTTKETSRKAQILISLGRARLNKLYLSKVLFYMLLMNTVYTTVIFWNFFSSTLSWKQAVATGVSTVSLPKFDFTLPPWQWPQLSLPALFMFDFRWPTRLLYYSGLGVAFLNGTLNFWRAAFYATFPSAYRVNVPRERVRTIAMRCAGSIVGGRDAFFESDKTFLGPSGHECSPAEAGGSPKSGRVEVTKTMERKIVV